MTRPLSKADPNETHTAGSVNRLFALFSSDDAAVLTQIIKAVAEIAEREGEAAALAALDRLELALLSKADMLN